MYHSKKPGGIQKVAFKDKVQIIGSADNTGAKGMGSWAKAHHGEETTQRWGTGVVPSTGYAWSKLPILIQPIIYLLPFSRLNPTHTAHWRTSTERSVSVDHSNMWPLNCPATLKPESAHGINVWTMVLPKLQLNHFGHCTQQPSAATAS